MSLIYKLIALIKGLFKRPVEAVEPMLVSEVDEESKPAPMRLNRATRREMAKVLRKHPKHKDITHSNLPLECSELEYLYWQMCMGECLTGKFVGDL